MWKNLRWLSRPKVVSKPNTIANPLKIIAKTWSNYLGFTIKIPNCHCERSNLIDRLPRRYALRNDGLGCTLRNDNYCTNHKNLIF